MYRESIKFEIEEQSKLELIISNGDDSGPTLGLLGGVHGDEFEGILAVGKVLNVLEQHSFHGRLIAVPIANPVAFEAGKRTGNTDGKDLARSFPGSRHGSVTEKIANIITTQVISKCDALIDLHCADTGYEMPLFCGYFACDDALEKRCDAMARAFGTPLIWRHKALAPGRSISTAQRLGRPSIYAEATGRAAAQAKNINALTDGVLRVMAYLSMIPSAPISTSMPSYLEDDGGSIEDSISAECDGYFVQELEVGSCVTAQQPVGVIYSIDGRVLQKILAPKDGVLMYRRDYAKVEVGDRLAIVASRRRDE